MTNNLNKKNSFLILFLIFVLTITGLFLYNNYKEEGSYTEEDSFNFFITKEIIEQDFKNKDIKLLSDVIPPDNYKDKYIGLINISLEAIESGEPSDPSFDDLQEDYLNIASSYSILGNYEESQKYYLELLQNWPKNYRANMNLGDLYIMMHQYKNSADKFLDTIFFYRNDFRIYHKLADLYVKYSISNNKFSKVDEIYKFAIKQANNPRELYKNYASFLEYYLKDYDRALAMEREYQKITGNVVEQEIERLQNLINTN